MSRQDPGSLGGFGQGANNAGWRPTGTNKMIYGDEVTEGSSGGNTSYNPETGKVHYTSYENTPAPTAAAATAAAPAAKKSSGSKSKTPTAKAAPKAAPKPASASAAPPAFASTGALSGLASSGGAGGGGALEASGGEGGGMGLLGLGMGGGEQPQQVPFDPSFGPGLRAGLGQRAYPMMNPALAGLRKIY